MRWRTLCDRKLPRSTRKLHFARRGRKQSAKHFNSGGLPRPVGAQQSVDFAVSNLDVDVLYGREAANAL